MGLLLIFLIDFHCIKLFLDYLMYFFYINAAGFIFTKNKAHAELFMLQWWDRVNVHALVQNGGKFRTTTVLSAPILGIPAGF